MCSTVNRLLSFFVFRLKSAERHYACLCITLCLPLCRQRGWPQQGINPTCVEQTSHDFSVYLVDWQVESASSDKDELINKGMDFFTCTYFLYFGIYINVSQDNKNS